MATRVSMQVIVTGCCKLVYNFITYLGDVSFTYKNIGVKCHPFTSSTCATHPSIPPPPWVTPLNPPGHFLGLNMQVKENLRRLLVVVVQKTELVR